MKVLVVGAGWRVRRFVLPALHHIGIRNSDIFVLRPSGSGDGLPAGTQVVPTIDSLAGWQPNLTINCAPAEVMLRLELEILQRFGDATHFCDTPGYLAADDASHLPLDQARLFSLEDWPAMPNFDAMRTIMLDRDRWVFRIEHFGILGHFVSLVRTLSNDAGLPMPELIRVGEEIVCEIDQHRHAVFLSPKDPSRSKMFLRSGDDLVEDFFEVANPADDSTDILARVVTTDTLHYRYGLTALSSWTLMPEFLHAFMPMTSRKNVHELDKTVALIRLLSPLVTGNGIAAYRYAWTIADAQLARSLTG